MSTFTTRMIGAARLDASSYEEVEADSSATFQAVGVVVLASIAAAIGVRATDAAGMIGVMFASIASWLVWVGLTLFIGSKLLPGAQTEVTFGQMFRTTGFSAAPGVLRIFALIPVAGWIISVIATLWMLAAFVVAVRQALDYTSTGRAIAVCFLGWAIHAVLFFGFVITAM